MLKATGAERGDRLQAFHQLAVTGELDKALQEIVAQRMADVAGDAKRAAVVHQGLGRLLFRRVGEQPAEIGHQLPLRFAELAQLPRDEEPRGKPFQAPTGTLLRPWVHGARRFQQPLEELSHQRRLAGTRSAGCPFAADETVLVVTVGDVIKGVAHQHAAAAIAAGLVLAAAEEGQIFIDSGGQRGLGKGRGRVGPAMIVAARGQYFLPRLRPVGLESLPLRHRTNHLRREIAEDGPQQVGGAPIARTVDQLESRKEQQQAFELVDGQPPVDPVQNVGHRADEILAHQVFLQAVNIRPQFLDHAELLFVDAADQDMDLAAVLREVRRDFIGDERAGQVGDLQCATNAVMVGDGHEVHPLLPRVAIDVLGFDKRFRGAHATEEPFAGPIGMLAVNVEVALRDACIVHGWDPSWNRLR